MIGRMQRDPVPGIRTNTVIVIGKVASQISPHLQKKYLIPVFSRSLRDPFVPTRKAALAALQATSSLYPPANIARQVVPAVTSHILDPSMEVREQAITTMRALVDMLEEHAKDMPDATQAAPPPTLANNNAKISCF